MNKKFYKKQFLEDEDIRKNALQQALDIRKFEIELYWKRASYFWTIIGVIFAGFFLLMRDGGLVKYPNIILLVNSIGFIFSLSWYLVNRGSKYWQLNWEKHVDLLEDKINGPIYKTVISRRHAPWLHLHKEHAYSVSKINQILSLYVTFIWFAMGSFLMTKTLWEADFLNHEEWIIAFITVLTALYLLWFGRTSKKSGSSINYNFDEEYKIERRDI